MCLNWGWQIEILAPNKKAWWSLLICVIFWSINSFPSWTMWRARRGVMRAHHAPWRSTCSDFLCWGRPASLIGKSIWGKHLMIESRCRIYQVSSLNETRRDEGAVTMFGNYATNWNGSQLDTRPRVGQQTVCLNDLYSMFLRVDAVSRIGDNLSLFVMPFLAQGDQRNQRNKPQQSCQYWRPLSSGLFSMPGLEYSFQ